MLDVRLQAILEARAVRLGELDARLAEPSVGNDPRIGDYMRERGALARQAEGYARWKRLAAAVEDNRSLAGDPSADRELRDLALAEIPALEAERARLEEALTALLAGPGADPSRNVILEIRAGTGGEEAALFAGDLYRMYRHFAEARGWKLEVLSAQPTDRGGLREAVLSVQGENVFRDLRHEGGGHRVQRVPETEAQGRVHTSAATVAVLPEAEEYEVELRPEDLKIEIQTSGGPGGQSVNTTQSSVRITHLPTGLTVYMQEEKSQIKNKAKGLRVLRSRLYDLRKAEEEARRAAERRGQTGTGDRSERVRTYNFPQDRCTDHRLGRNFALADVIAGKLDRLAAELAEWGKARDIAAAGGAGEGASP